MNKKDIDVSSIDIETIKEFSKERKSLLDGLADYKLPKSLEEFSTPLTRGERKKYKKLIEDAEKSDDNFDTFVATILLDRGMDEKELDKTTYSDIMVTGKRLLLSVSDVGYIVKKK